MKTRSSSLPPLAICVVSMWVLAMTLSNSATAQGIRSQVDPYADRVVDYQVYGASNTHTDPSTVLGIPCKGAQQDLSLGGGWVIVDLGSGEEIIDLQGADLRVHESEDSPYCNGGVASPYEVFVSGSPSGPWTSVGTGSGVSEFDLAPSGLRSCRYVRVEDRSSEQPDDSSPTPGADIAGFEALHMGRTSLFVGQGFDKCETPTLGQLQTWKANSPYQVVNLYIGGSRRSCANTALTASYLTQLSQQGWKFIPTWVGPQCLYGDITDDLTTAYNQGVAEASAAMAMAANLALTFPDSSGTIIYYDMEAYSAVNPACREPVKAFISGWTAGLRASGNLAGVYGSSGASNLSDFAEIDNVPDAIWPAGGGFWSTEYSPSATVWGNDYLPDDLWNEHQRIYQYTAGHQETWGGVSLTIDCDVIDGIVASLGASHQTYLPVVTKAEN
jgi:hypothetical protein